MVALVATGIVAGWIVFTNQKTAPVTKQIPAVAAKTGSNPTTTLPTTILTNECEVVSPELLVTAATRWKQPIPEEAFARFRDWSERYLGSAPKDRASLLQEGVLLAEERQRELVALIKSNPERAIELSVPMSVRQALPSEVAGLLEQRIAARGDLEVMAALAEPGKENEVVPTWRLAQIGGKEYKAFVYGRRLGEPTRNHIPLNGIAVNNLLAVNANPVRVLEPEEAAAAKLKAREAICSVSGLSSTVIKQEVAVEVGEQIVFVCRAGHIQALNDRLTQAESGAPGPTPEASAPEASSWTEGQKNLILIRVDFSDLAGGPFADMVGTNLVSGLNSFYSEMSYGRASFSLAGAGSEVTPIFRMPQTASYYGTNDYYNQLRTDARAAATAAGYVLANYHWDVTCMGAVPGFGWAGLAYVGGAGAWIRNTSSTGVTGHELGHNYGLNHANYWDTAGASVTGPGTSVEYGDPFDTMGSASAGNNHFNARYKNYLNWLTTNEVATVSSNGTYRVFAHDNVASTGVRGLSIVKNASTNYWIEFRQKFTSNKWLMSGAGLRWGQSSNQKSHLLDTTPGSTDLKNDSAIVIGRTFSDLQSGIHITPIGKGGTVPESLDVVVNLGSFPTNVPPTISLLAAATNAATGGTLNFSTDAIDANGDALAYYWDFGDGNFGTNGATASKSWSSAGEYVVRCTVTDMKGGTASDSLIVVIGSPTTYRISGQVLDGSFQPIQNIRMFVSTTRMTYTDSDGTYTLVGLPAGTYTVSASLENYSIASTGLTNTLSVGPSQTGIDFIATFTTLTPPSIASQPVGQTVNPGASATFSVTATGTAPMSYQWRFNSTNIAGATSASYTKANVQATNAGNYSVVVSNLAGTVTSSTAILAVNSPPSITAQPQSQMAIAGTNVTFTVGVNGTAPLTYQWRFNSTNIFGATAATFTRTNVQAIYAGNYTVIVTNSIGSVTSSPAALSVGFTLNTSATYGGTVSRNPDLPVYISGTVVTLTATPVTIFPFGGWTGDVSGTNNPLTVVVETNKTIVANFISPVADLIVDNPLAIFTGTWTASSSAADKYGSDYRTVATSANSTSATATFTPTVATAGSYDVYLWFPTITKGFASAPFTVSDMDGSTNISVDQTTGSGGWKLLSAGRNFAQGTNGFVRLGNQGMGGKTVVADAVRLVYSENQTVPPPPIITSQPISQTVKQNAHVVFSVAASGVGALVCQWRFNATNLFGATNGVLDIPFAQVTNAGNYSVIITNYGGAVTSSIVSLAVMLPLEIRSIEKTTNGQIQLNFTSNPGDVIQIESSTNLLEWLPLTTLTNVSGSVDFLDLLSTDVPLRLYRGRIVP